MKKTTLLFLLFVGTGPLLIAQNFASINYYSNTTKTEVRFNQPRPGFSRIQFEFIATPSKNRFILELNKIRQLKELPNIDSLLQICLTAIRPLVDSIPTDIYARRIDVRPINNKVEIRTLSHESNQTTFVYQTGTLNNLKIEQDTLRMSFLTPSKNESLPAIPGFVTILVNNLSDLYSPGIGSASSCIALLEKYVSPLMITHMSDNQTYNAIFNLTTQQIVFPTSAFYNKKGVKSFLIDGHHSSSILPAIYGSMQFTRGSFVPSFAAGLSYIISANKRYDHRIYLMWEPYFLFSNNNNRVQSDRNDFVVLRKVDFTKPEKGGWEFVQNFSIGYLVGRRGNWFEENTFKFSLPGIRNHTLQIEPEFYFNNFFKNFSPSLRLGLYFE
jgi:hypothetical protein